MAGPNKITIPIGGMSCKHCVAAVTEKLASMPGVTGVDVDLARGQAVVTGQKMDIAALRSAIEDLGYDAGDVL